MGKFHLQKIKKNCYQGQVLIEVLVALAVVVIVVSTITISTATSLANVQFSRTQNQATQYTQEGIEILRNLRLSDFPTFNALSGSYCLAENSIQLTQAGSCSINVASIFKRAVIIEKNNIPICAGGTKVTVTSSWTDGKCTNGSDCHVTTISSCIAVTNVSANL